MSSRFALALILTACGSAPAPSAAPNATSPASPSPVEPAPAAPGALPAARRAYPYADTDAAPVLAHLSDVTLALLAGETPAPGPLQLGHARAPRVSLEPLAAALDFTFRMPTASNPDRLVHLSLFSSAAGLKLLHVAESTRARAVPSGLPSWLAGAETDARLQLEVVRGGTEREMFVGADEAAILSSGDSFLGRHLARTFDERFGNTAHLDDVLRGADEPQGVTLESFHLWGRERAGLRHVTLILTVRDGAVVLDGPIEVLRVPADLPI